MEQQENHLEYYSLLPWVSFSSLDTLFYDDIRQRSTCGIGGINTLCWLLNYHCWMDFVWTFATSFSDKEYLKCTSQVFSYKPHPKKDWQFYSWGQVETFSLMRIKGGRSSRDFRLQSNQMFWKSQSTCWMSVYHEESLKPCPTLSESGVSNKIVNSIKNLKVKRSKNFIQSIIATIEGKNEAKFPN